MAAPSGLVYDRQAASASGAPIRLGTMDQGTFVLDLRYLQTPLTSPNSRIIWVDLNPKWMRPVRASACPLALRTMKKARGFLDGPRRREAWRVIE